MTLEEFKAMIAKYYNLVVKGYLFGVSNAEIDRFENILGEYRSELTLNEQAQVRKIENGWTRHRGF